MRWYLLLATALVFNAVANIMMKAGMRSAPEAHGFQEMVRHYLTSWPLLVGLLLFGLNLVAYTQALTRIPLSVAYPVMTSVGFLIVVSASCWIFKESVTWIQLVGMVLIIGGVWCVAR